MRRNDFHAPERRVKIRKDRKCNGCHDPILKGTVVQKSAGVFEGDFYSFYLCDPCEDYMDDNRADFVDGWDDGDIGLARREQERRSR